VITKKLITKLRYTRVRKSAIFKGLQLQQFLMLWSENLYSACPIPNLDKMKSTDLRNKNNFQNMYGCEKVNKRYQILVVYRFTAPAVSNANI